MGVVVPATIVGDVRLLGTTSTSLSVSTTGLAGVLVATTTKTTSDVSTFDALGDVANNNEKSITKLNHFFFDNNHYIITYYYSHLDPPYSSLRR